MTYEYLRSLLVEAVCKSAMQPAVENDPTAYASFFSQDLLKVLALGQQEVAAGKVKPLSDVVARIKAKKASA